MVLDGITWTAFPKNAQLTLRAILEELAVSGVDSESGSSGLVFDDLIASIREISVGRNYNRGYSNRDLAERLLAEADRAEENGKTGLASELRIMSEAVMALVKEK